MMFRHHGLVPASVLEWTVRAGQLVAAIAITESEPFPVLRNAPRLHAVTKMRALLHAMQPRAIPRPGCQASGSFVQTRQAMFVPRGPVANPFVAEHRRAHTPARNNHTSALRCSVLWPVLDINHRLAACG